MQDFQSASTPASLKSQSNKSFGELRRLDLRSLWPHEALSFTPWLANNLGILGNLIGMELELVARESPVGPFSLDLLLQDVGTDRIVVVENQIEPTNHDHLGKLLTYAAGNGASVAIWIASEFRDEHRQALDWLNGQTGQDTEFFGIVLEALQIDDSRPAPHLRLVSYPNDFRKRSVERQQQTTERGEAYRAFFQKLIDRLRIEYGFTQAQKGQPQGWYGFASGYSGVTYAFVFGSNHVRVELYIDRSESAWNKALFDILASDRNEIEAELGHQLDWNRLDNRRASRVAIRRPGSIADETSVLIELEQWGIDQLLRFKNVFGSRLPNAIDRASEAAASLPLEDGVESPLESEQA